MPVPRVGTQALSVTVAATGEPLTTLDAKDHLRIASTAEDILIDGLVSAARQWAENYTRRAFMRQTFRYTLDDFPRGDVIELPRSPLIDSSDLEVTYYPTTARTTGAVLESTKYFVDGESEPPRVVLHSSEQWPTKILRDANAVEVSFKAGYGLSSDVPMPAKHAMKLLVGHWHENREGVVVGSVGRALPMAVESLLAGLRVPSVP